MMTRATSRQSGFTLVEVLIAIGITGMMLTGVWMTLDQAVRTRNLMSDLATPYVIGPAILDKLAQDLSNAYFYDFKENATFYGSDADLLSRPADALSFVTMSRTAYADYDNYKDRATDGPKRSYSAAVLGDAVGRHSYANEVGYLLKAGEHGFLTLCRREDFFVDDYPHRDGDYVILYDKVHSLSINYAARNTVTEGGIGGAQEKDVDDMWQEGWDSSEEGGMPRALFVELKIYAKDEIRTVEEQIAANDEPKIYTFHRTITLPQVHMSPGTEQVIRDWDGTVEAGNPGTAARRGQGGAQGGEGGGLTSQGGAREPAGAGGRGGGRGGRGGGANNGRGGNGGNGGTGNPFLDALRNRGGRAAPPPGGLGGLFGGQR